MLTLVLWLLACNIQKMIGKRTAREYLKIIERNLLPNCPVTREDILLADKIFGPYVGSLKGKTVCHDTEHMELAAVPVPLEILSEHHSVIICVGIIFVNKNLPFLVTISRKNIKSSTAVLITDQKHGTLLKAVRNVRYLKRCFQVDSMLMDMQFEGLAGDLAELGIVLNTHHGTWRTCPRS